MTTVVEARRRHHLHLPDSTRPSRSHLPLNDTVTYCGATIRPMWVAVADQPPSCRRCRRIWDRWESWRHEADDE